MNSHDQSTVFKLHIGNYAHLELDTKLATHTDNDHILRNIMTLNNDTVISYTRLILITEMAVV